MNENTLAFLEQAGNGCISGSVSEWPQLKPACAWAANVAKHAAVYVDVDGPDRTWLERKTSHERLGRALDDKPASVADQIKAAVRRDVPPSEGDIVQVRPEFKGHACFRNMIMTVDKAAAWGVRAYAPTDRGMLYLRISNGDFDVVGRSRMMVRGADGDFTKTDERE